MEKSRPSGARQNMCYYTESDQILRIRSSKALAAMALGADPAAALLVPHRGVPLPTPEDFAGGAILATEELRFNGGWSSTPLDAARDACCFPSDSHACLHTHAQSREALRASTKLLRALLIRFPSSRARETRPEMENAGLRPRAGRGRAGVRVKGPPRGGPMIVNYRRFVFIRVNIFIWTSHPRPMVCVFAQIGRGGRRLEFGSRNPIVVDVGCYRHGEVAGVSIVNRTRRYGSDDVVAGTRGFSLLAINTDSWGADSSRGVI